MRRHSPRVFRIAHRFFRRREEVEEAAQEAFLRAYSQLASYEGRGSFEGWLSRVATNTCLNLLRSARRRPESTVSDLTEDESGWLDAHLAGASEARHRSAENSFVAADLAERVLKDMSPEDRLVLMMVDGEGATIKETAEVTGWSESKVKVRAFRARRRMRKAVEELMSRRVRGDSERTGEG